MKNNSKVIRLKKKKTINIGIIIFFVIFIYIIIYVCVYFTKPHLSIFEVQRESLSFDTMSMGVIIRDETVVYTQKAGYINYYFRDGARIKKNSTVYSVDENRAVYEALIDSDNTVSLTENDITNVKSKIVSFRKKFIDDYSIVYSFQEEITGMVQQLADENLLANLEQILSDTGASSSLMTVTSEQSGIISYHVDSLDGLTIEEVTNETFNQENFTESFTRKVNTLSEIGSKAYKLITSEDWSIVVPVTEQVYKYIEENSTVKIQIQEDGFEITVPVRVESKGSEYYAILSLDRYMLRYLNNRFLTINFLINIESGLKIPLTAITEKEFFKIPLNYFTYGGDSENKGVITVTYDSESGKPIYKFEATEIYYSDDKYGYIDKKEPFTMDTFLFDQVTEERFRISLIDKLEGVFNINKGYAVFRRIERMKENNEYCIIRENTENGLALYDHIALDASTISESAIIY